MYRSFLAGAAGAALVAAGLVASSGLQTAAPTGSLTFTASGDIGAGPNSAATLA